MKVLLTIAFATAFLLGCQSSASTQSKPDSSAAKTDIKELSVTEAQVEVAKAYSQFVDVRTTEEYASGHAARAVNIPLDTISNNLDRLKKDEPVYLICQTGSRSKKAAIILSDAGFTNVINITGGTSAWEAANLPMETKPPHSANTDEEAK